MKKIDMSYYNVYYYCNIIDNLMYYFTGAIDWAPTAVQFTECFFEGSIEDFPRYSALHTFCHFALAQLIFEDAKSLLVDIQNKYDSSDVKDKKQKLKIAFTDDRGFPVRLEIDSVLDNYGQGNLETFLKYLEKNEFEDLLDAYNDFCFLNGEVEEAIDKLAKEVFFILFQNREFLLRFNSYLAGSNYNKFSRTYIPLWVKRAVKYRDKGKCVCCGRYLSGLLDSEEENLVHFDHIVSLDEVGLNDVSNIQLLCKDCNLAKSTSSVTSSQYGDWYDMED